ncbi:MAG: protease family protein [Verrucomicrobiota bacterium]|jgi:membrane protease YdiL (CAAX protease family)
MKTSTARVSDPLPRLIAWSAVIASALPEIIWQESGHRISFWFTASESLLLVLAALAVLPFSRLRGLARFFVALAALNFAWDFLAPALGRTNSVHSLSQNASWGARLFIARIPTLSGILLLGFTLIGSGVTRRDLFLGRGNLSAPAQPIPLVGLRKPIPWTVFGPALLVVFGVALPLFLYFTVYPDFTDPGRILRCLPWILLVAALNAANEEFQFRSVLLAHLRDVVSPGEGALLTAVLFGLGHYYGQPSGPIGVAMAGVAGWLWARSMIETRGFVWAFFIHMVQDIVIFSFLAVATAT